MDLIQVYTKRLFQYVPVYFPSINTTGEKILGSKLISLFLRDEVHFIYSKSKNNISIEKKIQHLPNTQMSVVDTIFQWLLTIIKKDTVPFSKTIGTLHHNCILFFLSSKVLSDRSYKKNWVTCPINKINLTKKEYCGQSKVL